MPDRLQRDGMSLLVNVNAKEKGGREEKRQCVDVEGALPNRCDENPRSERAQHLHSAVARVGEGIGARELMRADDAGHKREACGIEDGTA